MKTNYVLIVSIISLLFLIGCGKPKVLHLMPSEEAAKLSITEIIENDDLSSEEKNYLITIKMSEELERKKKAVETEKDNKLAAIINRPVSPLRTPDTVLRVLVLPYEDDNGVLNSWKYSFIKVDDGKWILADYLNSNEISNKQMLTPLAPKLLQDKK